MAVKGVLSTIFGLACIVALFFDDKNFLILAYTSGATAALSGLLTLVSIINTKIHIKHFGLFHYEGIASLLLGIWILVFPSTAITLLMSMLGGICAGLGLIQIALAFDLQTYRIKEGILIFSGILTVLLGIILLNNPAAISGFINLLLGVFFCATGGHIIRTTYKKLTSVHRQPEEVKTPSMQPSFSYATALVEQQQNTME